RQQQSQTMRPATAPLPPPPLPMPPSQHLLSHSHYKLPHLPFELVPSKISLNIVSDYHQQPSSLLLIPPPPDFRNSSDFDESDLSLETKPIKSEVQQISKAATLVPHRRERKHRNN